MADAAVTNLEVADGVLHITGSGFTQTTTTVYVNDVTTTATYVSATELIVDPAPPAGAEIVVEKGGVQSAGMTVPGEPAAPAPVEPGDIAREQEKSGPDPVGASVEPEKAVTIEELGIAANEPYPSGGA